MHLKTINAALATAGLSTTLAYGKRGAVNFVRDGVETPTGIVWVNRLTKDEWLDRARKHEKTEPDTIETGPVLGGLIADTGLGTVVKSTARKIRLVVSDRPALTEYLNTLSADASSPYGTRQAAKTLASAL